MCRRRTERRRVRRLGHGANRFPQPMAVRLVRSDLLSKPDGTHLQQTGGEFGRALRVRLRATENDNAVGLESKSIDVRKCSAFGDAEFTGIHGRANRGARGLFVYARSSQDLGLAMLRRSSMAAHCGYDKWL